MRLRGRNVAGIGPLTSPMQPVAWSIYLTTADADETARKVREAGGTVVTEPFDIVDAGRMAVVVDPTGAAILAWQAGKHTGVQLANEANALVWSDLCTPDVEKARSFYRAAFGLESEPVPGMDYTVLTAGDRPVGGMRPGRHSGVAPALRPYPPQNDRRQSQEATESRVEGAECSRLRAWPVLGTAMAVTSLPV
jgi:uncharacterized protein